MFRKNKLTLSDVFNMMSFAGNYILENYLVFGDPSVFIIQIISPQYFGLGMLE